MGKEWIKIKETGQLYLEKILVSLDIPILFICADFENRKYLCLNIDEETGETVVAETDNKNLIAMLENKITMESAFREGVNHTIIVATYDSENEKIVSRTEDAREIAGDFLPEKGAFLELPEKMVADYISFLKRQLMPIVVEEFCEGKTVIVQIQKECDYFTIKNEKITDCKK